MKEIHEFRIWEEYYHLLPEPNSARFNGIVFVLKMSKDSPLFRKVGTLDKELRVTSETGVFSFWDVKRIYTKKELAEARFFHVNIRSAFEPTGEERGTLYDESIACEICGSNRKQIGPLRLKKGSIPKKDIARTIAGEVVVSQRFATDVKKWGLKGLLLEPIVFGKDAAPNYFQLAVSSPPLEISNKTITGHHPFDLSAETAEAEEFFVSGGYKVKFERTVLKCPRGHLIGSKLISEPYIKNTDAIRDYDFFASKQKVGAKQGLLRPEPIYLCSSAFRNMILEEKLTGFDFEIAHLD